MDGTRQPQLDYAPPLPWRRRKNIRRWAVVLLLALGALAWAPALWNRVRVLWWQRQCLAHVAPADQVVYDDGPAVPQLLSGGGMIGPRVLASTRQPVAARTVKCWDRLRQLIDPGQSGGVLYLHRGRNTLGAERLIVVAIDYRSTYVLRFVCWALRPATAAEGIGFHANSHLLSLPFDAANKPLQFYAGQPDPNDPSRFTIRYKLDGQLGTIEGWVDEGAGVSLAVKDGPAKER